MSDPELKLNSLSRFTKQSPRLVLEENSACEVPAGCGGVLLRWRTADEPVPMIVRADSGNGERERIAIDGEAMGYASKALVSCGEHALTLVYRNVVPVFACLVLAAKLDEQYVRILRLEGDTSITSAADGTWKYRLSPPDDPTWERADFDDTSWQPMVRKPLGPGPWIYSPDHLAGEGAQPLGVAILSGRGLSATLAGGGTVSVFIRKRFRVLRAGGES